MVSLVPLRAQIIFFIPYLAVATNGNEPVDDVYAVGKIMFIGIIGAVSLEISLIARYWTWLFFGRPFAPPPAPPGQLAKTLQAV